MLTPVRLTVSGFRGFTGERSIELLTPAVILSGGNHCGKSSTLNAVEWCLFGDQCKGKDTNIRERVGWVIPNQYLERPEVCVELRLDDGEGEFSVRRRLHQPPRKKTLAEELEVETSDGELVSGAQAQQMLSKWLRSTTFRDFSTTVYQHQETIRGIVTLEPRERNDAIDRLLGLSDFRNLLSGVTDANAKGVQRQADDAVAGIEDRVRTALAQIEKGLEEGRRDAEAFGVPRLRITENTATGIANQVAEALIGVAQEFGLGSQLASIPTQRQDLPAFERSARDEIRRLRGAVPEQTEQSDLLTHQATLSGRIADYDNLKKQEEEITGETRTMNNTYGSWKGIGLRLVQIAENLEALDQTLREIAGRQKVVFDAVEFLEQSESDGAKRCPVCEQEAGDLLPVLRERLRTAFEGKLKDAQEQKEKLRGERQPLEAADTRYRNLDSRLNDVINTRCKLTTRAGELLKREIGPEDDPLALLKAEREDAARRLKALEESISARQERLTKLDGEMDKLRCVRQVIQQENRHKIIEEIKQSVEFQDVCKDQDRLAEFVNDIEEIRRAISATAAEEARQKLNNAEITIDSFFRKLAKNPAVTRIVLQVKEDARSGRNAYSILDQHEQDLTPVLSQGDLNALALAIFLGLASASGPDAPMGFVMLDDPSQSMGTEHKRNLAAVLDEVCKARELVVATMDDEFRGFLDAGLTKAKTTYVFEEWTPKGGPTIRRI